MNLMPTSLAARWARTTPATVFASVTAMASSPIARAVATSSSGCEPPLRKEKFVVTSSSA
jgi:hypothetical protein